MDWKRFVRPEFHDDESALQELKRALLRSLPGGVGPAYYSLHGVPRNGAWQILYYAHTRLTPEEEIMAGRIESFRAVATGHVVTVDLSGLRARDADYAPHTSLLCTHLSKKLLSPRTYNSRLGPAYASLCRKVALELEACEVEAGTRTRVGGGTDYGVVYVLHGKRSILMGVSHAPWNAVEYTLIWKAKARRRVAEIRDYARQCEEHDL